MAKTIMPNGRITSEAALRAFLQRCVAAGTAGNSDQGEVINMSCDLPFEEIIRIRIEVLGGDPEAGSEL